MVFYILGIFAFIGKDSQVEIGEDRGAQDVYVCIRKFIFMITKLIMLRLFSIFFLFKVILDQ